MERSGQDFTEFAKQAFQGTLDTALKVQQQTQRLMEELMRQTSVVQDEGKRVLAEWVEQSKKHMEDFQKTAAEGYRKWEAEVTQRFSTVSPATKHEVQELRQRVDELARKVEALEKR